MNKFISVILLTCLIAHQTQAAQNLSDADIGAIIEGILYGAMEVETPDILLCGYDVSSFGEQIYNAVQDFKEGTFDGAAKGVEDIGNAIIQVSHGLIDCKNISSDIAHLAKMSDVFASPDSFFYNAGMNLLVNGVEIYAEIDEAVVDFDNQKYFEFGENLGKAISMTFLGPMDPTDEMTFNAYKVFDTFVQVASDGMVYNREVFNHAAKISDGFINYLNIFTKGYNPENLTAEEAAEMLRNVATLIENYISKLYKYHSFAQNADKLSDLMNCIKYVQGSDLKDYEQKIAQQILVDINLKQYDRVGYLIAGLAKECQVKQGVRFI